MTKRPTATPIAPKIGAGLHTPTIDELLDERQWTRVEITGDHDAVFADHDLDGLHINECRLVGANLGASRLDGARLIDVVFENCNLSGASLYESVLTRVEFRNCRLSGLILNAGKLRDVRMIECKADQLGLRMITAERFTAERSTMPAADITGAQLVMLRLFDCDLTSADLSKARFDDARLHGSDLADIRGIESIRGVTIDGAQMHDFAAGLLAAHDVTVDDLRDLNPWGSESARRREQ